MFRLTETLLLVLYFLRPWAFSPGPYDMPAFVTLLSALYLQVACLCLLMIVRFAVIVTDGPSGMVTKPFDFYAVTKGDKPPIYRMVAGVAMRCVNSVLWLFRRLDRKSVV